MKTPSSRLNHNLFGPQRCHRLLASGGCALAACLLLLGSPSPARAQVFTYNFDSGSLSSDWEPFGVALGLTYNVTFPTVGTGKGVRLTSIPYSPYPAIAAIAVTNTTYDYTDFYVAADLVNWTATNQAVLIEGRYNYAGGLAASTGMILNWDLDQDGDTPTDRYGGELQINIVGANFSTTTGAAAEMTPVPGHSYRMIFKCVGQVYTGQVYDLADLTAPLVTLQFTDSSSTYTHGLCGLVCFGRSTGNTDVTWDNFYSGPSDPNTDIAPAIRHSIPGTPVVETRSVASYQNFYNPASGLSFTAKTHTAATINSSATKLLLNGVDVTSQATLTPSGGGTVLGGSLPGSSLKSNAVYSAQVSLADSTGLLTSINTFYFDTFSDAYLASAAVKTIECEDYNYSNGVYQLDPIPVSGMPTPSNDPIVNGNGVGYYDGGGTAWMTKGTEGVDFHAAATSPNAGWVDYRANDPVQTGEGIRQDIEDELHSDVALSASNPWDGGFNIYQRPNDNTRQKYAVTELVEYLVIRTVAGDWQNYTRSFTSGTTNYFAFLRAGAYYPENLTLSKVTSDPTLPSQTTSDYGTFSIPNGVRQGNCSYIPLLDANGVAPILALSGVNTLRLTKNGTAIKDDRTEVQNYLLLVPASVGLRSSATVAGPYAAEPTAVVNVNARTITIATAGTPRFYRLESSVPVKITGISVAGGTVTIKY